ncbi:MAG TPA: phage tail sheath C-terminal domain-containing protein [Nodosilinea sp.]|nr:phage tail sheath C-terminal domain-containing protein [Nodosilinea sp.]
MPRLDYFAPGVYVEEIDRGSRPIDGVATNVASFIGFTEDVRGGAELFKPVLVTTWNQYLQYFSKQGSDGFTDFDAYLPFAVNGWFLNGGGRCWVMSLGTRLPGSPPPDPAESGLRLHTSASRPSLRFMLKPEQHQLGPVDVRIQPSDPPAPSEDAEDAEPPLNTGEYFKVLVSRDGEELETFDHLTMDAQAATYAVTQLQTSEFIAAEDISQTGQALARRPAPGAFEVTPPIPVSNPEHLSRDMQGIRDDRTGIQGLFEIDEITMMACPDLMRAYQAQIINQDQLHGMMETMLSLCENSTPNPANRMIVLDTPPDREKPQAVVEWLHEFGRRSMYGALYYPWVQVANPRKGGRPILVPPCGHMMGIWSRTDETRGVYKAPANETPRGVIGLGYDCNFREQELLNPLGINCIRTFPNRGIRVWGARTLVEPDKTEWRYINVRRLISYIERSIELGTQWVVFEPNDQDLWARVRRTVSNFLERLWREGALFGATPDQAFYVKCDGDINTPDTMILGRLYVEIGVCPVRPAEFVIFRISQWTAQDNE